MSAPRSIFDADMSRPVQIVRPRPDQMALPEHQLAAAMADEVARNRHMRPARWQAGAATRSKAGPDGMPGNIKPGTVQASIWQHLHANGPCTVMQLMIATRAARNTVLNSVENLARRVPITRNGKWTVDGTVELGKVE